MLAISRALMSRPSILLLDEPSLGLAPIIVTSLFETIVKIRSEGVTVLMVEQNAYRALEISDRGYIMQAGQIIKTGLSSELIEDPAVKAAYLGE
jgi:branched-chain amino acid transport system ATP-binding protein